MSATTTRTLLDFDAYPHATGIAFEVFEAATGRVLVRGWAVDRIAAYRDAHAHIARLQAEIAAAADTALVELQGSSWTVTTAERTVPLPFTPAALGADVAAYVARLPLFDGLRVVLG